MRLAVLRNPRHRQVLSPARLLPLLLIASIARQPQLVGKEAASAQLRGIEGCSGSMVLGFAHGRATLVLEDDDAQVLFQAASAAGLAALGIQGPVPQDRLAEQLDHPTLEEQAGQPVEAPDRSSSTNPFEALQAGG